MQYHLDGYQTGDPAIADPSLRQSVTGSMGPVPQEVDVLIVGSGPAGLTLAAQLSAFADLRVSIVEQKAGPLLRGQADGVACRTMEMFEAFGFAERVLKESYWVNETTFWRPNEDQREAIVRSGRVADTEEGLSEFPHTILNQARVHDFYLELMRNSPARIEPFYARRLVDLVVDVQTSADASAHAVTVRLERMDPGHEGAVEAVRARFVVGCDGARSRVRKSIGQTLHGDSANHAWGVMDVLVVTDFPDIRLKSLIQSAQHGSMVLIPREGGYLVRVYIELDKLDPGERVSQRDITAEHLIAAVRRILQPYTFDVKEVAWWSVYEIGQRLCDRFDDVPEGEVETRLPRVFIAGDACHTHSPKAGQGMNVSMQDGFNLGWKLAAVLRGQSGSHLLPTYSAERQAVARELIDFDREWSSMLTTSTRSNGSAKFDPAETQRYFVRHGRYTAGTATHYRPSLLTGTGEHQNLATGFVIGTRLHSAPVVRLADAKPLQLGHTVKADGRWHILAFAGREDPILPDSGIGRLCTFLSQAPDSPVRAYTAPGTDLDSVIDVRAIFQEGNRALELDAMPAFLLPAKGRFGLRDYEKIFCVDTQSGADIFALRGIARDCGCLVVVRPDQYIAQVLPLNAFGDLTRFFGAFMTTRR